MSELITDEIIEATAGASWEQGRLPGWPAWEEFSRRAAADLWDCRELRETHVRLTRELLEVAAPLIAARARELESASPRRRAPKGQNVTSSREQNGERWWWTCDLLHQAPTRWTGSCGTQDVAYTALDEHNVQNHPHLTEEARRA